MEDFKLTAEEDMTLEKLKILYESGKNPLAYIPYAEALRRAKALAQALDICKEGLAQDSYSVSGRTLLARILFDMGRYDNALEELGFVLQLASDAFGANFLMARILIKKQEFSEAMDIIKKIKKLNKNDSELLRLEEFVIAHLHTVETVGDISTSTEPAEKVGALNERVNTLLENLRTFPGVTRYKMSMLPKEKDKKAAHDPLRILFIELDEESQKGGHGALKRLMFEAGNKCFLVYVLEESVLTIETTPEVNIGMLRLQVENSIKF